MTFISKWIFRRQMAGVLALCGLVLLVAGCGSGVEAAKASGVSVVVSGSAQVRLGGTTQFTATVTGSTNTSVTWQVNGVSGGSSAAGTISASGLYTPPVSIPTVNTVAITAVSQADATASGSAVESILNPLPVLTSATMTYIAGTNYLVTATGSGFVSGSAIQVAGISLTTTYISATQLTAVVTVTAGVTSVGVDVVNPAPGGTASGVVNVTINIPVTVAVSGTSPVRIGSTAQFTAMVTGTSNTAVTWQVNGTAGGSSAVGTISASGLYTAPAAFPATNPVTITAVSQVDTLASGSASETVWSPLPVLTSAVANLSSGNSYTVSASGAGFVSGSVMQVAGTNVATTVVSSTQLTAVVTIAPAIASVAVDVVNPDPGGSASNTVSAAVLGTASLAAAARMLDQTSFGPTAATIGHVQGIGLSGYLAEQFAVPQTVMPDVLNPLPSYCGTVPYPCAESELWQTMLTGDDQLRQRVAFALSEMFVVSTASINGYEVTPYHNMLASNAFGNFYDIMHDVTLSMAMGSYLDMLNSAKPATGQIANENYPRELMQLFTLGLNLLNSDGTPQLDSVTGAPIPVYTEAQVQAFARAYTGWTSANADGTTPTNLQGTKNFDHPMVAVQAKHDLTSKAVLLGTVLPAGQSAEQDLQGALTNIFNHPNVGPFVCKQLIQHLVTSSPSPAYVARVAAVFADNGSGVRGDMKAVVTAILMDTEARAGDTSTTGSDGTGTGGGHLREPVLWMTGVMRGLEYVNTNVNGYYGSLSTYALALNERPYRSGSVFNFFPPSYVIPGTAINAPEFGLENTASVILRLTQANNFVYNKVTGFTVSLSATSTLGALAANPAALVDQLGVIFMHAQMPDAMRTDIINHITPMTDKAQRARVAAYLVIASSQYKIEH